MHFIAPFSDQAIAGQTFGGWAIEGAMLIKEIALEKNNSLIGEKPPNSVGTKEENRYKK